MLGAKALQQLVRENERRRILAWLEDQDWYDYVVWHMEPGDTTGRYDTVNVHESGQSLVAAFREDFL